MNEIKRAADELFHERRYHEITLKAIAEKLGWSHAALYKYVSTKEEIFLDICSDKRGEYSSALLAAYPEGCDYSHAVLAEVWTEQLNSHRDYLSYSDLLFTIIETNVSAKRLAVFKRDYYEEFNILSQRFCANLHIDDAAFGKLLNAVLFHAVSVNGWCADNPLVKEAMALAGLEARTIDFKAEMREFIGMCLEHYTR